MDLGPIPRVVLLPILLFALAGAGPAVAQQAVTSPTSGEARWEPLFLGYETAPGMDYAGRTVASLAAALDRALGSIGRVGATHPAVAPAWEFPAAALLLLAQHEVGGHGGRAREFGLGPSYSFSVDLSGSTGIARPPASNEEGALLAAGGTEADGVMASRVLLDLLRPEGGDGARVPLAILAKLDLTTYVAGTRRPDGSAFVRQYRDGNDVAIWMVSRQAARLGADPASVWAGAFVPDLGDRELEETWRQARVAALWNLLDPSLVAAGVAYFRQHVLDGEVRVHAPTWKVAPGLGLTLGTRSALGPGQVTRFLDLHGATPWGIVGLYVRDLESLVERTWGFGASLHAIRAARDVELAANADAWTEPSTPERLRRGSRWHASVEVNARLVGRWGVAATLGGKARGFFPGLPLEGGAYGGLGATASW